GTAADAHFKTALVELSDGDAATAFKYAPLVHLTTPVTAGTLFGWPALPPDGKYALRLTVEDEVGLTATATVTVTVDTQPPAAPIGLTAAVEARKNVRLNWTPVEGPDLAGYHVYRDGVKIRARAVTSPTHVDEHRPAGFFRSP